MSKSKIKVSFTIEVDDDSELGQELDYLDSRKLFSRIRERIADHITEQFRIYPCYLDDKNIDVRLDSWKKSTREFIINSMCVTYRHDFGLVKTSLSSISSGMTPKEREILHSKMSDIFDKDIAPYMEFK